MLGSRSPCTRVWNEAGEIQHMDGPWYRNYNSYLERLKSYSQVKKNGRGIHNTGLLTVKARIAILNKAPWKANLTQPVAMQQTFSKLKLYVSAKNISV